MKVTYRKQKMMILHWFENSLLKVLEVLHIDTSHNFTASSISLQRRNVLSVWWLNQIENKLSYACRLKNISTSMKTKLCEIRRIFHRWRSMFLGLLSRSLIFKLNFLINFHDGWWDIVIKCVHFLICIGIFYLFVMWWNWKWLNFAACLKSQLI